MEDKYFERYFNIEHGLENNGYVELRREIEEELKGIQENSKLANMYHRIKLKLNKHEAGIVGMLVLPFVKLIFSPLLSVLLTLITIFFTFLNVAGDVFYRAGMETGESVLTVVEAYSEMMIEMYAKGLYLPIWYFAVIVLVYLFAYVYDYKKQQRMKKKELYYKFILEIIKEEMEKR